MREQTQMKYWIKVTIAFLFICFFVFSCSLANSSFSLETKLMFGIGIIGAELLGIIFLLYDIKEKL